MTDVRNTKYEDSMATFQLVALHRESHRTVLSLQFWFGILRTCLSGPRFVFPLFHSDWSLFGDSMDFRLRLFNQRPDKRIEPTEKQVKTPNQPVEPTRETRVAHRGRSVRRI
jgi:hypothetical protein